MAEKLQLQPVEKGTEGVFQRETDFTEQAKMFREAANSIPNEELRNHNLESEHEYSLTCLSLLEGLLQIAKETPSVINPIKDSCLKLVSLLQRTFRKFRHLISNSQDHKEIVKLVNVVADDPDYDQFALSQGDMSFTTSSGRSSQTTTIKSDSKIWKWIKCGLALLGAMVTGGLLGGVVGACTGLGIIGGVAIGAGTGVAAVIGVKKAISHKKTTKDC